MVRVGKKRSGNFLQLVSLVHVLYFFLISLKLVERCAKVLLYSLLLHITPLLLGYFWQHDAMQEGKVTGLFSFLIENRELCKNCMSLSVTSVLGWKCS